MNYLDIKNGTLYSTCDLSFALSEASKPNSKIMLIDDISDTFQNPNIIRAGVLLPPYDAMCAYDNHDESSFMTIYQHHIISCCTNIIASMIGCMMNEGNILLYIPEHIYKEVSYFLIHMQNLHGIVCGNERIQFMYIETFNDFNIGFLYKLNCIHADDYLFAIRNMNFVNDLDIVKKLISDLNPILNNYDIKSYYEYFIFRSNEMKKANKIFTSPIKLKENR